ncbi:MAG: hypothetical protein EWM72_03237 [Nitrospira sp.]|nr:MAG: hypothetical protein EWM72_03237 [Nitrospira sp.]
MPRYDDVPVFVATRIEKILLCVVQTGEDFTALRFEDFRLTLEHVRISRGFLDNPFDGAFHLISTSSISLEYANAKRLKLVHHLLTNHAECLGRVAGNENTFPLSQQVSYKVGDRVGLACPWGTLYQHAPMLLQPLGDLQLFRIGRFT